MPGPNQGAISAWHEFGSGVAISAWHEFGSGAGALRARKSAWHRAIGGDEVDMLATDKMSVVQREGASCGFEEGRGTDGKPNANDQCLAQMAISAWHKWLKEWLGGMRNSHGLRGLRRLARKAGLGVPAAH